MVLGPSRRDLIAGGLALGACGSATAAPLPALKDVAARRGVLFGSAIEPSDLDRDPDYARLIRTHCNLLIPENAMKWDALRPTPEAFDFARADRLVELARAQDAVIHSHCLMWHEALPAWMPKSLDRGAAINLMETHISTVMKRYAGAIRSYDVVNEAVQGEERADGLRVAASVWFRAIGKDYIPMAFAAAHAADPAAKLVYAEGAMESDDLDWVLRRREHVLDLLKFIRAQGVPIHALAMQGHLEGMHPAYGPPLRDFMKRVADLGLEIYITELDVVEQEIMGSVAERDRKIAGIYRGFLDIALQEPAVTMINTWQLSDRYTSKNTMARRADGMPPRPLPFDADLKPKLAAHAIVDALKS